MKRNIQLGYFSIYWDTYMKTVTTEYWDGSHRRKFLTLGIFTFWRKYKRTKNEKAGF